MIIYVITISLTIILYTLLQSKNYVFNIYDTYVVISKFNLALIIFLLFGARLIFYINRKGDVGLVDKLDLVVLSIGMILFVGSSQFNFSASRTSLLPAPNKLLWPISHTSGFRTIMPIWPWLQMSIPRKSWDTSSTQT